MKKKILSIMMAALFLIAAAAVPAGAISPGGEEHVNACSHVWVEIDRYFLAGSPFYPGEEGCYRIFMVLYKCLRCGAQQSLSGGTAKFKNHRNKIKDGGHRSGKHTYIYECEDCHYRKSVTVACPGPPCFLPEHVHPHSAT